MRRAANTVAIIATGAVALATAAASGAQVSSAHWCRQGDPPLYASEETSCQLAGTIITAYDNHCHESVSCRLGVSSPSSHIRYRLACHRTGRRYTGTVYCHATSDPRIWTRFSSLI